MNTRCRNHLCYNTALCHRGYCDTCCDTHCDPDEHLQRSYSSSPTPPRRLPPPAGYIGAELEVVCETESQLRRLRKITQYPCSDSSIHHSNGLDGIEIKCLATDTAAPQAFANIAAKATSIGAIANSTCGFHVHIDIREIPTSRTDEFLVWAHKHEEWFYSLIPPRRRTNEYVRPIQRRPDLDQCPCLACQSQRTTQPTNIRLLRFTHHTWIQTSQHHPTIEIRLHPGTTNPIKVHAWTQAMATLGRHIRQQRSGSWKPFPDNPIDIWREDPTALSYINARILSKGTLRTTNNTYTLTTEET